MCSLSLSKYLIVLYSPFLCGEMINAYKVANFHSKAVLSAFLLASALPASLGLHFRAIIKWNKGPLNTSFEVTGQWTR